MIDVNIVAMQNGCNVYDEQTCLVVSHAFNPCEACARDNIGPTGELGYIKEITLAPPPFKQVQGFERDDLPVRKVRLCFDCVAKLCALLAMP